MSAGFIRKFAFDSLNGSAESCREAVGCFDAKFASKACDVLPALENFPQIPLVAGFLEANFRMSLAYSTIMGHATQFLYP